jgi:hypothetical protein
MQRRRRRSGSGRVRRCGGRDGRRARSRRDLRRGAGCACVRDTAPRAAAVGRPACAGRGWCGPRSRSLRRGHRGYRSGGTARGPSGSRGFSRRPFDDFRWRDFRCGHSRWRGRGYDRYFHHGRHRSRGSHRRRRVRRNFHDGWRRDDWRGFHRWRSVRQRHGQGPLHDWRHGQGSCDFRNACWQRCRCGKQSAAGGAER